MLDEKMIYKIIKNGETEIYEWKSEETEGLYESIAAFANANGGVFFLGIDKNGNITGVDSSEKYLEKLTNRIVNKLGFNPIIETITIDSKRVIVISVDKSSRPISYNKKYYIRVGNTKRGMLPEELQTKLLSKSFWEAQTGEYSFDEIDMKTVQRFSKLARNCGRLKYIDGDNSPEDVLSKLKLIKNGRLTHAAILLFGKDPQQYFVNSLLRILRLKDDTHSIGDKPIGGNLFNQMEDGMTAIQGYIDVSYEIIPGKIQREEIWDYPLEALRELLLNAIIHRDYQQWNIQTQIKVYDDKIRFSNIGGLYGGLDVNKIKVSHDSRPRNPLIAKVFYLAGYVEQYGSGIGRVLEAFRKMNLSEPEFIEEQGGLTVIARKTKSDLYVEKSKFDLSELNERQKKAFEYVIKNGKITNSDYQEITRVSKKTSSRDLKKLVDLGLFKKQGETGKGTHYILEDNK